MDGMRTLPFSVVAAKSLASDDASDADSIECVIVHASACIALAVRSLNLAQCANGLYVLISGTSQGIHALGSSESGRRCSASLTKLLERPKTFSAHWTSCCSDIAQL